MADRSVATTDTLAVFRREVNSNAADIGDIADIVSASGFIASATDIVESITLLNTELPEITTDAFVFPGGSMIFEGATADASETTLAFTDPTADRTFTFPDVTSSVLVREATQTLTNKTLTTPTITSGVFNTAVSGTAVLDEDNMASDSATKVATQQSIVAYTDSIIGTLPVNTDSGNISIGTGSETLTIAGGTGIDSVGSGNSLTLNIANTVATLTGTQTVTNKTLTSPTLTSAVLNTAISGTAFLDEDNMASDSATQLASQQSVKAYVDAVTTNIDLDFQGDSGGALSIDLDSETLTLAGGTGIDSAGSGNSLTLNIDSTVATLTGTQTLTNKTLTSPTLTSAVLNTAVSGSAVLDEDNMASNSATKLASQQSIKAYVDAQIDADMDLVFAADSGSGNIVMDSESLTLTGGTGIDTSGSSNTVTFAISNAVATLAGTETLTNKTFTSPTLNVFNFTGTNSSLGIGSGGIIFEGATADDHETTLTVEDPSQDNTITLPNVSGDIITDTTNPRDTKAFLFSMVMAMG